MLLVMFAIGGTGGAKLPDRSSFAFGDASARAADDDVPAAPDAEVFDDAALVFALALFVPEALEFIAALDS